MAASGSHNITKNMKSLKCNLKSKCVAQSKSSSEIQPITLTGSQMNLAQRDRSPHAVGSRPASACHRDRQRVRGSCPSRRPASAEPPPLPRGGSRRRDLPTRPGRAFSELALRSDVDALTGSVTAAADSYLGRCQRAGFCGTDALLQASQSHRCAGGDRCTAGFCPCKHGAQLHDQVEILGPEVMRYAYTAESARLLQSLLREPWHSEGSDDSPPSSARSRPHPPSPQTARNGLESPQSAPARALSPELSTFYARPRKSCQEAKTVAVIREYSAFSSATDIDRHVSECSKHFHSTLKPSDHLFRGGSSCTSHKTDCSPLNLPNAESETEKNSWSNFQDGFSGHSLLIDVGKGGDRSGSSGRTTSRSEDKRNSEQATQNGRNSSRSDKTVLSYQEHQNGTEKALSPHSAQKRTSENLDSVPSKDSGRTESTLCLREPTSSEEPYTNNKNGKEEEIDLRFKRWFPNFEKETEKSVRFFDTEPNGPELIDLADDRKVSMSPFDSGLGAGVASGAEEKKKGGTEPAATPRDSNLEELENILHVLQAEDGIEVTDGAPKTPPPSRLVSPLPSSKPDPGRSNLQHLLPSPQRAHGSQVAEIFQYLDQAERCSDVVNSAPALRPLRSAHVAAVCESTVPRMEELLCRSSVDLAQEVLSLRLQAEEQAGGIRLLQTAVAELKEVAKVARAAHQAELGQASNEAEAALLRHQKMVKQLLAEKKGLNEKMALTMAEIKAAEERHQRNLKAMEERHLVEMQRLKETHAAAERLKREKWIDVKTQKIKEMTVKGLEPELSRMAARQQQELNEQRNLHRTELEAVELRAARRTTELMDELRTELARDKEDALQRESANLRLKFEKRLEEDSRLHEEETRRLKDELRRERDRLSGLEVHVQEQLGEARRHAERDRERDRAAIAREWQERLDEAHRQHQVELKSLKEALELEKDVWMNNFKKIQSNKFLEREADLHHQYKRERDRDIEIAIERLETEATKAQLELTEAAENKLRRLREKMEGEVKDAEAEIASLKAKLSDARQAIADQEDQRTALAGQLRHQQAEYTQLKQLCEEMTSERSDLRRVLQAELSAQLAQAHKAAETARSELAEMKTAHAVELAKRDQLEQQIRSDAEKELQHVYNRVRVTVQKKDEALSAQREQYKIALERCSHLEQMLENQRRNLLLK